MNLQEDSSSSSSHHLFQSTLMYGAGFSSDFNNLFHQPFCSFWIEHRMFLNPTLVLQPCTVRIQNLMYVETSNPFRRSS